jgi:3-oxoacyl-ACP reductase-like protein
MTLTRAPPMPSMPMPSRDAHAIDEQAPAEEQAPAPAPAPAPAAPANNGTAKSKAEILEELLSGGKDERVDELIARISTLENSISAHYRIDIDHGKGQGGKGRRVEP